MMRNLLAFLGLLLVVFLGLGWYLDWYRVTPKPAQQTGHNGIEIDINSKKIGEDVQRGVQAGTARIQGFLEKTQTK